MVQELKDQITHMKEEMDILESHSRRDNLRIFGVPQVSDHEDYDTCVMAVTNILNTIDGLKKWTSDDIVRAHRIGQARGEQPRPMIIKFTRWRDKMTLLTDKDVRQQLQDKGIRIANDLTRAQAHVVAEARRDGKRAYFRRGKMVIGPALPDRRSFAEVTATGIRSQQHTAVSGDTHTGHVRFCNPVADQGRQGGELSQSTVPTCYRKPSDVNQQPCDEADGEGRGGSRLSLTFPSSGRQYEGTSSEGGGSGCAVGGSPAVQQRDRNTNSGSGDRQLGAASPSPSPSQRGSLRNSENAQGSDVRRTPRGARGGGGGLPSGQTGLPAHWGKPTKTSVSGSDRNLRARYK